MTGIVIYIEGGGDSTNGKSQLRQGFDALLGRQKQAARAKRLRWDLVLCGGRNATFDAFQHRAQRATDEIVGLLVDAEDPVAAATPAGRAAHLAARDGWNTRWVTAEHVHLMTQCMESWLVADADALERFYGQRFNRNALPRRQDLDQELKQTVYQALESASRQTSKGAYGKIKHASQLLACVRPHTIAARCTSFRHFTEWLDAAIAAA